MNSLPTKTSQRLLVLILIVTLAFAVRALTANFLRAQLSDPGWFPSGIYGTFDQRAQNWLDGRASIFWIDDPSRTDAAIYPPGYPLWLALVYKASGSRSPIVVQNVQWVLDTLSVTLIVGLGVSAFGWPAGLVAGGIAALWPLLAFYGCLPLADAPTSWLIISATWMLLLAAKRASYRWAVAAGALIGASCWFRANALFLALFCGIAILLLVKASLRKRLLLAAVVIAVAVLMIAPIVIRNAVVFHAFVPTGLGAGTNLWEGIGDTARGREFGAAASDVELIEQERIAAGLSPSTPFELYYPDGIQRDRARTRQALTVIRRHPFWYAGVVAGRMVAVMKFAGRPNGIYGSAGINVTAAKSLPPRSQGALIAFPVNFLGMLQSLLRYLLLPLMIVGIFLAFRLNTQMAGLLSSVVAYYWVVGSLMHTHIRYGLPMYSVLTVFAALTLVMLGTWVSRRFRDS